MSYHIRCMTILGNLHICFGMQAVQAKAFYYFFWARVSEYWVLVLTCAACFLCHFDLIRAMKSRIGGFWAKHGNWGRTYRFLHAFPPKSHPPFPRSAKKHLRVARQKADPPPVKAGRQNKERQRGRRQRAKTFGASRVRLCSACEWESLRGYDHDTDDDINKCRFTLGLRIMVRESRYVAPLSRMRGKPTTTTTTTTTNNNNNNNDIDHVNSNLPPTGPPPSACCTCDPKRTASRETLTQAPDTW